MKKIILGKNGGPTYERQVFKAALHTHTVNSDGHFSPEQVIDMYKSIGYDVIVFSDHKFVNKVSEYDGRGMTLVSGVELHPAGPRGVDWHILAIGVPEDFKDTEPATGQEAVDCAVAAGAVVFCAHPYWCGLHPEDVMQLENIAGIEVFNSTCRYLGKELNMYVWDACLDAGKEYTAIAVDDMHDRRNYGGAWTMVCARSNSAEDIVDALKKGDFYATQGPEFTKLVVNDGVLEAEFTACQYAVIVGRKSTGTPVWVHEYIKKGEPEETTEIKIDLRECPEGLLRIQLRDSQGRYCWSNPVNNTFA